MAVYLGKNKVGITKFEDIDTEITEQEKILAELETQVNKLSDKPSLEHEYFVKVIDYDGTVLKEANLHTGDTFKLPNAPSHDGLVFQEWSCSQDIVGGVITIADNNVMVGAVYTTASGLSEFDIELTKATGLDLTFNMDGTKDWGDGTSDDLKAHTYINYGKYTIKCNGTKITTYLFGQSGLVGNSSCVRARLAGVTSIGNNVFNKCHALTSVTIPSGVTSFGIQLFHECRSLTSVTLPNSVTSVGHSMCYSCYTIRSVTIPNSVTSISSNMFYNCYSLTDVVIPNSVTSIDGSVFYSCRSLTSMIIPRGVTSIGTNVFWQCYSLTDITIPDSVTSFGGAAFYDCRSLTSVTIPNSVTSIGGSMFYNCYSLTDVTIPYSVTSIGGSAFYACYSLTSITIPSGVTSISDNLCYDCYSLQSIVIPDGVTTIGKSVFNNCCALMTVVIPDEVTSIGNSAFYACRSLTSVTLPDSVTTIGGNATFSECVSVTTYDFSKLTVVPPLSSTNAFYNISKIAKIIVPDNLYDEWVVATNWTTYADYIYKASEVQ